MTSSKFSRLIRRLALARHRIQDRVLLGRGIMLRGTPARRFRDIATYITHAAVNRLEGRPHPRGLGFPGICDHPWFASRQSAVAMGRRHGGSRAADLFDHIMRDFPLDDVVANGHLVERGTVGAGSGPGTPYSVHAAEMTVVSRPDHDHYPEAGVNARIAVEHRLYALVRLKDDVVGAVVFQRDQGSDLYRIALIGMRPRQGGAVNRQRRREEHAAFKRFNAAIRHWPGVSFDFLGAAEPAAAAMGYSLFRHLRRLEMTRLKALTPEEYEAERLRVASYRYPAFPRSAVVTTADTIRAALAEAPGWILTTCRSAYGARRHTNRSGT